MNTRLLQEYYNSPEYLNKLRQRVEALQAMEDPYVRAQLVMDKYAVDPVAFIEHFCFVTADKLDGGAKAFFMFDYQKELVYRIQDLENGNPINGDFLVDKPREMGISWIICAYFLWRWLFTPNYSCFLMSRTEAEVDCGTRQANSSLFGKIRWLIDHLPPYFLPEGFTKKGSRGTATDANLKLINPQLDSIIIGSSTNSNAGRSRRYRTIFVDEIFAIDRFQEVMRSLESVSKVKICASTVQFGRNFENFKGYVEEHGNYMSLNWKDHPFKDQEWYDSVVTKAREMDDPDLIREIEPTYAISDASRYYPGITKAGIEGLNYDPRYPMYVSLDLGGKQDLTVLIWWQFDGQKIKCLRSYANRNRPVVWYAPFMNPNLQYDEDSYTEQERKLLDEVRKMKKPVAYFGEADHFAVRHPSNTSSAYELGKLQIVLMFNRYAIAHEPRRTAMEALFGRMVFNGGDDSAVRVYDAIAQSRYSEQVRSTNQNLKPVHDKEIADFRAAAENFAVNIPMVLRNQADALPKDEKSMNFHKAMIKKLRV